MNLSESLTMAEARIGLHEIIGLDQDRHKCLEEIASLESNVSGGYCQGAWDGVHCWPPTSSGTVISQPCSEVWKRALPEHGEYLTGNALRICQENSTWLRGNVTNFDECAHSYEALLQVNENQKNLVSAVQYLLFVGSILSLCCLIVSLSIYYCFKCLRCDRVTINVHLMLALALRAVLFVVITEPFVLGRVSSYRDNDVACKFVISVYLFATLSSVSWMLIQGIYIHSKLTTNVFNVDVPRQFFAYYCIGWGIPAVLLVSYVGVLSSAPIQEPCWRGYSEKKEIWIIMGPITFTLIVNGLFLVRILRIVVQNTRQAGDRIQDDIHQVVTAAKATLLLSPILGVNNLLVLYNPGGDFEKYYVLLNTTFGATQGIIVSVVYCFVCKDVHSAMKRMYKRFQVRREIHGNDAAVNVA